MYSITEVHIVSEKMKRKQPKVRKLKPLDCEHCVFIMVKNIKLKL